MDINGLTTLNRISVILFGVIGSLLAFSYYVQFGWYPICKTLAILWICIILVLTLLLYYKIVFSLDDGDYKTAKTWILIGIIVGLAGGIIPFILFLISYVMFDDAIRTHQLAQRYYNKFQQLGRIRYCSNCNRQIPFDSMLCPYCGVSQSPIHPHLKPPPPPPK